MKIKDIYPENGEFQRIYCNVCNKHMSLSYSTFDEVVENIHMRIRQLPILKCDDCGNLNLPDKSRAAIIFLFEEADKNNQKQAYVNRNKPNKKFTLTKVDFNYDSDDYYYIPGLYREMDDGFLTPVFFNSVALLKFDNSPIYRLQFGSKTYGYIRKEDEYGIPFGINKNGKLIMWLGDIARLPINEQYYLLSENIESDHTIGSEFYDGQIECIFTELSPENELIKYRDDFLEFLFQKFSEKLSHLDNETFKMIEDLNPPILFTDKELHDKYDTLNKILIESLDNDVLNKLLKTRSLNFNNLGSLKKLQNFLEYEHPNEDVKSIISPLFVLYDLRVAYSHLGSDEGKLEKLKFVCDRLKIKGKENDSESIYNTLVDKLIECYKNFVKLK